MVEACGGDPGGDLVLRERERLLPAREPKAGGVVPLLAADVGVRELDRAPAGPAKQPLKQADCCRRPLDLVALGGLPSLGDRGLFGFSS